MSQVDISIWQTEEVANEHPNLKNEISDLIEDTFESWYGVGSNITVKSRDVDAPGEETTNSGSGYACFGDQLEWDRLIGWWSSYATSCFYVSADSNLLITNGDADPDNGFTGEAYGGGQFAVVEHGPLASSSWNYSGAFKSSSYEFRLAMNSPHEVGHNLDCDHRDGRLDKQSDGDIQETIMTNRYGPIAIPEDWDLNCNNTTPDSEGDYTTKNDFSSCAKSKSYL